MAGLAILVLITLNACREPEAEGDHRQRFFGDGAGQGGSEVGSGCICQETLSDGKDRRGHSG